MTLIEYDFDGERELCVSAQTIDRIGVDLSTFEKTAERRYGAPHGDVRWFKSTTALKRAIQSADDRIDFMLSAKG